MEINFTNHPSVIAAIQFGSSISGDTYEGSDVDLLIVVGERKEKEKGEKEFRKNLGHNYQIHTYHKKEFLQSVEKKEPLSLSMIHTGKVLHGRDFISDLNDCKPNDYTVKKCMLNSFAALGMGLSDLLHGMMYYDAVNSLYHAARSSIWATLMDKEITPSNKRVLELLENEEIKERYKEIIHFRSNIPDCEHDFELDKKVWEKGDVNEFTGLLRKVNDVVKENYQKVFDKPFLDCFDILDMLRKSYKTPDHYMIMLSVNWEKMFPFYHVMFSYGDKWLSLMIDAHDGSVKEEEIKEKEIEKEVKERKIEKGVKGKEGGKNDKES